MEYQVVFDASQKLPDWEFPVVGLIFVIVGVLLWVFRYSPRLRPRYQFPLKRGVGPTVFAAFFLGFSLLVTVLAFVGVFGPYLRVQRAMREQKVSVVEGTVENFHPMHYAGHDTERFTVGGVSFEYSDYLSTPGFNVTSSHGGPVREGAQVMIHYIPWDDGNLIVRLAVAR
jgi:hypothetical protein